MGSSHSVPARFSEKPTRKQRLVQRRNKLTKPRTNSNSTPTSCLPFFLRRRRLSPARPLSTRTNASRTVRNSIVSAAEEDPWLVPLARRGSQSTISVATTAATAAAARRRSYRSSGRGDDEPLPRGSWVLKGNADLEAAVTNLSLPLRRRSTLRAAPATISRRSTTVETVPSPALELGAAAAKVLDDDKQRCNTPSGYSVLGVFKRGSLHITNGQASPSPAPTPTPDLDLQSPLLIPAQGDRAPTTSAPIEPAETADYDEAVSMSPDWNRRVVPPSPRFPSSAGNPFGFQESSGGLDPHDYYYYDDHTYPDASSSSSPKLPSSQQRYRPAPAASAPERTLEFDVTQGFRPVSRRSSKPSIMPGSDSGYSSTTSTTSWRTCEDGGRTSSLTTSMTSRSGTFVTLDGGIFGTGAPMPPRCGSASVDEYGCLLEPFPTVSRSSSCGKEAVPDRITGQSYYQRFVKRRSQLTEEEQDPDYRERIDATGGWI